MEFAWDVFVPEEDRPHRLTTDYLLLSEDEEIAVGGRAWLVERVELIDAADAEDPGNIAAGTVTVVRGEPRR